MTGIGTTVHERLLLGPRAAARARLALAHLENDLPAEVFEDLRLLVTELVTNSFRHAGLSPNGVVFLNVEVGSACVHVEVEDRGRGFTLRPPRRRPIQRESGWGLTIVERVAERWGVVQNGSTVVWFDLGLKHDDRVRPRAARASR